MEALAPIRHSVYLVLADVHEYPSWVPQARIVDHASVSLPDTGRATTYVEALI